MMDYIKFIEDTKLIKKRKIEEREMKKQKKVNEKPQEKRRSARLDQLNRQQSSKTESVAIEKILTKNKETQVKEERMEVD